MSHLLIQSSWSRVRFHYVEASVSLDLSCADQSAGVPVQQAGPGPCARVMPGTSIYTTWLPQPVAEQAVKEEPKRFHAGVEALLGAISTARASDSPNRWAALLSPLLDDLKTLISAKTEFEACDVKRLIYALYEVVLETSNDVEVQVRVGDLLSHVLRHHRHSQYLGLALTWRPLYDMLLDLYDNPVPKLRGTFLDHVQQSTLFTLVTRCRRWFAPGAAAEIWELLRPALVGGDPMSTPTHCALGWLVLFFPTKQLPQTDPAVAQVWVREWIGVWGRVVHCTYWSNHWMYLLARAAKDDWKGVVDWDPFVSELYSHMLSCFHVPVGTATANCPTALGPPHKAAVLFGNKLDQVDDQAKSAAKLAVHLLKQQQQPAVAPSAAAAASGPGHSHPLDRSLSLGLGFPSSGSGVEIQGMVSSRGVDPEALASQGSASLQGLSLQGSGGLSGSGFEAAGEGVAMSAAVAASADALDALVQLLEQYCHPSNTGPWSSELAVFLRHGVHYFMKVLGRQCGSAGWPGEQVIVAAAAKRYIRAAVKLAQRGQFSKKDALVSTSCKALCHLSYVWPGAVLPLVLGRFQAALQTATAMHQLPTSITSLAMCARPLLLAGWHTAEETTPQLIAEAMMAVLPGIDANDESKTAAVFQFYTAVLSSIPHLAGLSDEQLDPEQPDPAAAGYDLPASPRAAATAAAAGGNGNGAVPSVVYRLPLYLEDWVDQVMDRLFTLLSNLDTGPSHRSTDQQAKPEMLVQSTHLGKDTLYHSFFQHLLARLPARLADHVVGLLGNFATQNSLPTVAMEASNMFRCAAVCRPAAAVERIIKPLMAKIRGEMPEAGTRNLSRSIEDSLTWHLVLLGSAVGGLRPQYAAPLVKDLEQIVDDTLKLPSRIAHNWASMVLSSLLTVLTAWYFPNQAWARTGGLLLPNGLQLFIDRKGVGWTPPQWAQPGDEFRSVAARLADKYLEQAAQQLLKLCSSSSSAAVAPAAGDTTAAAAAAAAAAGGDADPLAFKTHCRALLATMAASVIGLMSRLRDFDGFADDSSSSSSSSSSDDSWAQLKVVGTTGANMIGAPGVRDRAAEALTAAVRHLQGGDRELLEQASYTSLLLMCPGMLEAALGGQGRQGGKDDGAIIDEPAAATALLLAYGRYRSSSADDSSSGNAPKVDGSGFITAFCASEQTALDSDAAAIAAAAASAATTTDNSTAAATAAADPASATAAAKGPGSYNSEWRWRRRTSPLAVVDRLRRMLLWRSAQAVSRAGPASGFVTPAAAAEGSVCTPVGCVRLQQLPQSYVGLFLELLGLSMMPNAGVRNSALPTLQSCMKRFPCLVEVLLPEVLAALAGVPGPLRVTQGTAAAGTAADMEIDSSTQQKQQQWMMPQDDKVAAFYKESLYEAMQTAVAAAPAAPTGTPSAGAAAAIKQAMVAAAAAAAGAGLDQQQAKAAAAAAVAAAAAKAAAAADGSSATAAGGGSVAKESENDGRVAGACALLASSLDTWRVVFRDPLVFQGFVYALMASRCHSSNACLKNIQGVIMQVMSRFKLPPLLDLEGSDYQQMQAALMAMGEPSPRVPWRYAVLSNMLLMFGSPPASGAAAQPLVRHCLQLLASDMLLLRQVGATGLWLMLTATARQVQDSRQGGSGQQRRRGVVAQALASPAVLQELKQALCAPDIGETLVRMLVLDHAKLDAAEAAKAGRGGGGGMGGVAGLLSGLLGMTAEEVMGAMVAAAVERHDRWPVDSGRPESVSEGTFEITHARLVRLLATLCPSEVLAALQNPIASRLQRFSQPAGPQEKAELATIIEVVAGLLAAAAPAAAAAAGSSGGSNSGCWVWQLLRDGLVGTTLEMAGPWGAGLWYGLDYLLSEVKVSAAAAAAEGMELDAALVDPAAAGDGGSPAGVTLQKVLQTVMEAVPTATRPAAAAGAATAELGGQGLAPAAAATSTGDQKRLRYILGCLAPIRRLGTFDAGLFSQQQLGTALAVVGEADVSSSSSSGWGEPELPKVVRVFLAHVMQEVAAMVEVEQPAAIRDQLGGILADIAVLFSVPAAIQGSSSSTAGGGAAAAAGEGSGYSSPADVELGPAAAAAAGGTDGTAAVLLVNSSMVALKAQAKQLLSRIVDNFLTHAALLEGLKNSGVAAAGAGGSAAAMRGSDGGSEDIVMVDAAAAGGADSGRSSPSSSTAAVPRTSSSAALVPLPADLSASLTPCTIGLQLLQAAHVTGESASLRPLLVAMLPGVLRLQELSGPGVQQLVGEAKAGFVQYKYLPLSEREVAPVAACALSAGGSESWSTRAAAMVYLQIFWFRHCYLINSSTLQQLQAFVVSRLQDPKVEVRSLATATLSGIIKALPAADNEALRQSLVSAVPRLFAPHAAGGGSSRKRSAAAAAAAAAAAGTGPPPRGMPVVAAVAVGDGQQQQQQGSGFLVEAQAVVQGLKAFVLSAPYDVPAWMPQVLMALVTAANSRNPLVRRDASKALSEFKRTHEEDAIDTLKQLLGEEQWEALTQVTSSASYFV